MSMRSTEPKQNLLARIVEALQDRAVYLQPIQKALQNRELVHNYPQSR
jgi:hypothetical protein